MNLFNRIVAILLWLALLVAALTLAVAPLASAARLHAGRCTCQAVSGVAAGQPDQFPDLAGNDRHRCAASVWDAAIH